MSAVGIGGFAQGLSDGYERGIKNNRENERAIREQQAFELAQASGKLDLEAKQRDADYQKELQDRMKQLDQDLKGGVVGGEVEDEFGTKLGKMQYANPSEADQMMKSQGLRFAQGTAIEKKGMDPVDYAFRAGDVLKETMAKYGKIDFKTLKESRDYHRQLASEGAIDALKYAHANPSDLEGAKAMFNKKGKIKIGDDVQLGFKDGMFGPTVFGYKVGPKGEKIEIFDSFRDIIMPSMSPEAYASAMANFKTTEVKEKNENVRLGAKLSSDENIAARKDKTDRAKLNREANKELNDIVKTRFTSIFRNPLDNAESARQKKIEGAVARRAEEYYATGQVGLQEAFDRAQSDVFRDYKVDTSELAPTKK